ncbi:putative 2'-deoxymugineic-acid 2'-dioxygenase [Helianthus anomalus]
MALVDWIVEVMESITSDSTPSPLSVISNGKLISPEHRAITNSTNHRTSIVYSINPKPESIIEPAKVLINESNRALYRAFMFKDFLKSYEVKKDYNEGALEDFKI